MCLLMILGLSSARAFDFFELRKVKAPAMKSANMTDHLDRAGSYLSAMSQAHRVTDNSTKH